MKDDDQKIRELFQRTNRSFKIDAPVVQLPVKKWFRKAPYRTYISMAASLTILISGSLMFPLSDSILEWSTYSFEWYQKGVETCMATLSQISK